MCLKMPLPWFSPTVQGMIGARRIEFQKAGIIISFANRTGTRDYNRFNIFLPDYTGTMTA